MKLSKAEKVEFIDMMEQLEDMGGMVLSNKGTRTTILIVPASRAINCRFYHLAISYCSEDDKWNKKRGKYEVLQKYFSGQFISIRSDDVVSIGSVIV